jgi:hypothetical protein
MVIVFGKFISMDRGPVHFGRDYLWTLGVLGALTLIGHGHPLTPLSLQYSKESHPCHVNLGAASFLKKCIFPP